MTHQVKMPLEKAVEIAENYLNPQHKIHTYGEYKDAFETLIVYARNSIPIGCLELEQRDKEFNIATDAGGSFDYARIRACKEVKEWYESPSYKRCAQAAHERGFIQDIGG